MVAINLLQRDAGESTTLCWEIRERNWAIFSADLQRRLVQLWMCQMSKRAWISRDAHVGVSNGFSVQTTRAPTLEGKLETTAPYQHGLAASTNSFHILVDVVHNCRNKQLSDPRFLDSN